MSTVSSDYVNYAAGSSACSYAPLGKYTGDYSMGVPFQGKLSNGNYIVPTWSAIGYDDLTNKVPNCSGYFDVNSAYGSGAGNCQTTYRTSLCGGGGGGGLKQDCASLPPDKRTSCCTAACQLMNWRPNKPGEKPMPNPPGCNPPLPGRPISPDNQDNTCRNLMKL